VSSAVPKFAICAAAARCSAFSWPRMNRGPTSTIRSPMIETTTIISMNVNPALPL
jgi:hypothetical protein